MVITTEYSSDFQFENTIPNVHATDTHSNSYKVLQSIDTGLHSRKHTAENCLTNIFPMCTLD